MVGGKVIGLVDCGDTVWVNCKDDGIECAIYVEHTPAASKISIGDSLWWHSHEAYWTPRFDTIPGEHLRDVRIPKVGTSGVEKPEGKE